ncbi:entry exclusion protein TrbK [Pararhizobium sp. DWP3-4]|uniref:entry exclusion protein TrbK n=1 Tax=Pararhizobium sp. DWP3-4 TaxID=2804565 RepID=UPI003CEFE005
MSATTMWVIRSNRTEDPRMTEEQRLTRQTVFGSGNELPPIEKGQEMRPRW